MGSTRFSTTFTGIEEWKVFVDVFRAGNALPSRGSGNWYLAAFRSGMRDESLRMGSNPRSGGMFSASEFIATGPRREKGRVWSAVKVRA